MWRLVGIGWLLACAACLEPAWAPPDPIPVALLTPDAWSGGEAVLASAAFRPPSGLPAVLVDCDTLAVRRIDDTTVAARLPDLPGAHTLRVLATDVLDLPIDIRLHGFESFALGPLVPGRVQPLLGWPPAVVGNTLTGAAVWDLRSITAYPLPDTLHDPTCGWGVGPSYRPAGVVLVAACGPQQRWWAWRVRPRLELIEDSLCATPNKFVSQLAVGRTLAAASGAGGSVLLTRDSLGCVWTTVPGSGTYDVVISPRGDRSVILAYGYGGFGPSEGVPVLDVPTGHVAYAIPQITDDPTAAFSPEGETLFVAGRGESGVSLVAVRADDGQVLYTLPLALGGVLGMAVDPDHPWLFLFATAERRERLLVIHRRSRELLTTLGVPDTVPPQTCCGSHIIPSPVEHRVYIVEGLDLPYSSGTGARVLVTRFQTPP